MGCNRFRKSLECVEENFLTQMVYGQRVGDGLLDLLLTNKEETVNEVKGRFGCHDHETRVSGPEQGISKTNSRIMTLDFRRADIGLFRNLFGTIS